MAKPTTSGATLAKPRSRIAAWAEHHRDSLVASLGRMFGKPWSTLLTVGVMAVALALPLGLALVLDNAARLGGTIER
ncbi:MAG: ABC transporter permease, partial [Lysobacteraceae bacterium]